MARKLDTSEYVRRMQQELFEVLGPGQELGGAAKGRATGEGDCQEVLGRTGGGGGSGAGHPSQSEQAQILPPVC